MIDLVGGDTAVQAMSCLHPGSRLITIPTITSSTVCEQASQLGIIGMGMLVEPDVTLLEDLLKFISAGMIKVKIEQVIDFQNVVSAHKKVESGRARGKILLNMQS